jgi:hypothetical protein
VLAVLGVILVRAIVKAGMRRFAKYVSFGWFEGLLVCALVILAVVFLAWFAGVKIRLRRVLGGLAALVGSLELLLIIVIGVVLVGGTVDVIQTSVQGVRAGLEEKAIEESVEAVVDTWLAGCAVGGIVANALWALLTAGLFLTLRRRLPVAPD